MGKTKKAAIAMDPWKLPFFEKGLQEAGYIFENIGEVKPGSLVLKVETKNVKKLAKLVDKIQQVAYDSKLH